MRINPDVGLGEGGQRHETEQIRLVRLDREGGLAGRQIVQKSRVRDGFGAIWRLLHAQIFRDEVWHLIVIPVRESQDQLAIDLVRKRSVRIMNDQRAAKPVWVLSAVVGMVPVRPWLINLWVLEVKLVD